MDQLHDIYMMMMMMMMMMTTMTLSSSVLQKCRKSTYNWATTAFFPILHCPTVIQTFDVKRVCQMSSLIASQIIK